VLAVRPARWQVSGPCGKPNTVPDHRLQQTGAALGVAEQALDSGAVWVGRLGPQPAAATSREQWIRSVSTVAAYRERWGVDHDSRPLGPQSIVTTIEHLGHRKRALAALDRALQLSRPAEDAAPMRVVPIITEMDGVGL
jgi:hypothetical protein